MTREQLERYHDITVRLKMLTSTIVTDTVNGSSDEYPYTSHPISIHGVRRDAKACKEAEILTQKKNAIDEYIDGLDDVRARMLLDMKYRRNLTWKEIEAETGGSHNADLKYLQRFFKMSNHVH
ncbi:hypothetical protein [Clostridium sp. KNHs216]|uniref:hypothetical protein n=1 Tax=Clostridium sp. KNHs216 TaxID=1550235 RepID=UPI00114F57C2|nr:hypothetical protein [Clostridium sp. KNHs216]TQI68992.1 hypothetical protein LY85_3740 [Clostridium sp. KNHs216]